MIDIIQVITLSIALFSSAIGSILITIEKQPELRARVFFLIFIASMLFYSATLVFEIVTFC